MKQISQHLKKWLAMALSLVMAVSVVSPVGTTEVAAAPGTETTVEASTLVFENYALDPTEYALITSGNLADQTYNYTIPKDSDNLITVDADNHVIAVKPYVSTVGSESYTWIPTGATVVAGEDEEAVALTNEGGVYTGTYQYAGNAFSVKASFELWINVDEGLQNNFFSAGERLQQGIANVNKVKAGGSNLNLINKYALDTFVELVEGIPVIGTQYIAFQTDDAKTAATALGVQKTANGGDLDLSVMISEASNMPISQYLMTKGADMKAKTIETYNYLKDIRNDVLFTNQTMYQLLIKKEPMIEMGLSIIDGWLEAMEVAINGNWDAQTTVKLAAVPDYTELDALVNSLAANTSVSVKNPLYVGSSTVQFNMSMFNVDITTNLQYAAGTVDSAALLTHTVTNTAKITLSEGATKAEMVQAIQASGVLAANAQWGELYKTEHFDVSDWAAALPESLTADVALVITYSPKTYTISYGYTPEADAPTSVPYGYQMTLPERTPAAGDPQYDYFVTVNGGETKYYEGTVITINADTQINRAEGKAYDVYQRNALIAKLYGTNKEASIINAPAGTLEISDAQIQVREPDDTDVADLLSVDGTILTAKDYESDYNGLKWKAVSAAIYEGTNTRNASFNNGSVDIGSNYDKVVVTYKLVLSNFSDAELLEIWNIPDILVTEAELHVESLDRVSGDDKLEMLADVNTTTIDGARGTIDGTRRRKEANGEDTTAEVKAITAIDNIAAECFEKDGSLKLSNYLNSYRQSGLTWYYAEGNYEAISKQVNVLKANINPILDYEGLEAILESAGYGSFYGRLEEVRTFINSFDLTAPNALINRGSDDLSVLVALLTAAGETAEHALIEEDSFALYADLTKVAANKANVKITVSAAGKTFDVSETYSVDHVLSEADVNALLSKVNTAIAQLNIRQTRYTTNYSAEALKQELTGLTLTKEGKSLAYSWSPKTNITVSGGTGASINLTDVNNVSVKLPKHTDPRYTYTYIMDGMSYDVTTADSIIALKNVMSEDAIDELFTAGVLNITATETDTYYERLVTFVSALNANTAGAMSFILTQDDQTEEYAILMQLVNASGLTGALGGFANAILESGYGYAGLEVDGSYQPLVGKDSENNLKVSMQTLIDAMMYTDGFGSNTILNLIQEDGTINPNTKPDLENKTVLVGNSSVLGGELVKLKMEVGVTAPEISDIDFYITLVNAPGQMVTMRNYLNTGKDYFSFVCQDGRMNVELTMPEKAYEAYMLEQLAVGETELKGDALKDAIELEYLKATFEALIDENVTLDTYLNTVAKAGKTVSVSDASKDKYGTYFNMVKKILNDTLNAEENKESFQANSWIGSGLVEMKPILDGLNLGDTMNSMIAEYEGSLDLPLNITVKNNAPKYQAVLIDVKAIEKEAVMDKLNALDFTDNLEARMKSVAGAAYVILLDDVTLTGDLNFPGTTILDLNGYTINGNVIAAGTLYIVDSRLSIAEAGGVTGTISGAGNITILGGNYDNPVTAYLKEGYVQDGKTVKNKIYTITEDNGNITFNLNSEMLVMDSIPNVKALAVDMVMDLAMNYYTASALSMDGKKVYAIDIDDLLGWYAGENRADAAINEVLSYIDLPEFSTFINDVLADLMDFGAIEAAVAADEAIASYEMTTAPWTIDISHVTSEDYLTLGITGGEKNTSTVAIKIDGANKSEVEALAGELAEIVDSDKTSITVDLKQPTYADQTVYVKGSAYAEVEVDLTKDDTTTDYAVVLAVILANGNAALKDKMVEAINYYNDNANNTSKIKEAFDKVTINQMMNAIKAVDRDVDFAAMAQKLGVAVNASAADVEAIYHNMLVQMGRALTKLDVSGGSRTMGSMEDKNNPGYYKIDKLDVTRTAEKEARGYAVNVELEPTSVILGVKVFGEAAPAETYDIIVTDADANVVKETNDLSEAFEAVKGNNYTVTIVSTEKVVMTKDIDVQYKVNVVNAPKIDQGSYKFNLINKDAQLIADAQLSVAVGSALQETYELVTSGPDDKGWYTYALSKKQAQGGEEETKAVSVYDSANALVGEFDTFEAAMAVVKDGYYVQVNKAVTMQEDAKADVTFILNGAANLNQNGKKFTLSKSGAQIIADAKLNTVAASVDGYYAKETQNGRTYTYALAAITTGFDASIPGGDVQMVKGTRYLFLDLDPHNGMTYSKMTAGLTYREFTAQGYTWKAQVSNTSGLVKTADQFTVIATKNGQTVASISYKVIVMGDTNCNGKVNSSDATVMQQIRFGAEKPIEVLLAGDVNFSGSFEAPAVNSSDATYIMNKYFNWDTYVSNLK